MKKKTLIKLGILSGTIAVGALIALNRPAVKEMAKNTISSFFAKEEDTFQTIHVTAQDIANSSDKTEIKQIADAVKDKVEETVSPYQDAHQKFETGEIRVPESAIQVTLKRVVDGDTYLVDLGGQETKIRLIGVDTPESVASDEYLEKSGKENTDYGKKASEAMKEKLPEGTTLFILTDVQEMDKYGRTLAYVFFEDGEMVQDYLLKNGYAQVMTVQPNIKYVERFVALEQQAMQDGVGIWQNYEDAFGYTDDGVEIE